MTPAEPDGTRPGHTPWDALVAVLLGAGLLAAGWPDVRSHLAHRRDGPAPEFAFLADDGAEHPGAGDGLAHQGVGEYYRRDGSFVWLSHLGGLERDRHDHFRHAYGPNSGLVVYTPRAQARLHFRLYNPVVDQDFTVRCNGRTVESFARQPVGVIMRDYTLALHPGSNDITFTFARYNHADGDFAPADPRPIAATFAALDLTLD